MGKTSLFGTFFWSRWLDLVLLSVDGALCSGNCRSLFRAPRSSCRQPRGRFQLIAHARTSQRILPNNPCSEMLTLLAAKFPFFHHLWTTIFEAHFRLMFVGHQPL
ncbi:hypothetical protein DFH09DRAFT_627961 [Mycena vulgaris]|nr:hypothetical protein DFH09DRAFT_627961 [Mycena vulgaris]